MSEMTSEPSESSAPQTCAEPATPTHQADLRSLCDRIVNWSVSFGTMSNRVTRAEADGMSEAAVDAATRQEMLVLEEMIEIATTITRIRAGSQEEIEWKQRVLNELTDCQSWERDSLYHLRLSIERDLAELNAELLGALPPQTQRMNWLSRLSPAAAEG